jgi:hypothetical protein
LIAAPCADPDSALAAVDGVDPVTAPSVPGVALVPDARLGTAPVVDVLGPVAEVMVFGVVGTGALRPPPSSVPLVAERGAVDPHAATSNKAAAMGAIFIRLG